VVNFCWYTNEWLSLLELVEIAGHFTMLCIIMFWPDCCNVCIVFFCGLKLVVILNIALFFTIRVTVRLLLVLNIFNAAWHCRR